MIAIILSIGAINAFIPLIIILILIVAAAGLMRGYNIFALFGISALLGGAGKATLAGKNVARKTEGVRAGLKTGQKAQALGKYIRKEAIPKARTFAKYYKEEYNAARANGVSRAEAAKIASANARMRMMQDKINKSQSSLDKIDTETNKKESSAAYASGASRVEAEKIAYSNARINILKQDKINTFQSSLDKIGSETDKEVDGAIRKSLDKLINSSALKNDTYAQNLYNSINSERDKLKDLADQANKIKLDRTSAAAAKANLNRMRQIQKDYKETWNNYVKDLYRFDRRFIEKGTMEVAPYYISKGVNLVMPNKLKLNVPKPSFLQNTDELQAHVDLGHITRDLEKSFKEAFKP